MTEDSALTTPTEIRAVKGSRAMEIDFADGHTGLYPHRILRGFCPCAACQGHEGAIVFVEGGDQELVDISEVGNYAILLSWGDGHATGIYSFRFLRDLCNCSVCWQGDVATRQFNR